MNILLLIDNLGSGGAQRQIVTLALLLKAQNLRVELLTYNDGDFFKNLVDQEYIPVNNCNTGNYIYRIISVRKFIRQRKFDAVISFLDTPNFLNCLSAVGGRSWKVITSERSSKSTGYLTFREKIFNKLQHYADSIVCNSVNAKDRWIKLCPMYAKKLVTIYNPIRLPEIKTEYIPWLNGKFNIVIAASYHRIKNMHGLIKALSKLTEDEKRLIHIDWYGRKEVTKGNTSAYDEANGLKKLHDLDLVISFHEETKDIIDIMYKADAVALFSCLEGLPNAICEAMMIGKPVLMSRVSDYSILIDETNGFLCNWDDPESIKEILLSAIHKSVEELRILGLNSKIRSESLFAPSLIIDKWLKLLK